ARAVLRAWGVRGDDAALDGLAAPLRHHAVSVDVLGSYLGRFCDGDPDRAPSRPGDEPDADPTARLSGLLAGYAERLTDAERDVLGRLSEFPQGATAELLGFLIDAGGPIAGALAGRGASELAALLDRLRDLGLVFRSQTARGATFALRPYLRE